MPTPRRIRPWLNLTVAQGNTVQIGGLLGACALAWYAGREGSRGEAERGTRLMVASRLLSYFSEYSFSHLYVWCALGFCFTVYGLLG